MLDGEEDDSDSNQNLAMPDELQVKISDHTWQMMYKQFARPTHASVGKDFIGLEDTLNDKLRQLGDTVVFDPAAQEVEAPQTVHKEGALYDPILQAQTIETQCKAHAAMELLCQPMLHQFSGDSCLEGAKEGIEDKETMEVDDTNYRQPDALISDHPAVKKILQSQGRTMSYMGGFNNVKHAKSFCHKHFNGFDLLGVYHPQEHHCATVTWGGRAKDAHV
jgi:hypothetical protein